jgi:hypothetical protein
MNATDSAEKRNSQKDYGRHPCAGIMRWDSLDSIILALTLVWAGIIFLSVNLGFDADAWSVFLLGAAILVLIEVLIRLLYQRYATPVIGDLIWAGILFWIGDWDFIWPFALVIVGLYIFYNSYSAGKVFKERVG